MRYVDNIREIGNRIYIYGAGMVAKLLYDCIKEKNIDIVAFVVSENPKGSGYMYNIPLIPVEDISEDCPIIIATLSNAHNEIGNTLAFYGITNYAAVSERLFENMRRSMVPYQNELASVKIRRSEMIKLYKGHKNGYITVSDSQVLAEFDKQVISSKDFLTFGKNVRTAYILSIKWSGDWKKVVYKAFCLAENVVLSFRYKYLNIENYSLIDVAKEHGYQLSGSNRFYRDEREYFTEDILLWFEKRMPYTLERDMLCEGCGLCEWKCPVQAIRLGENVHGYRKPKIDNDLCINCGKCVRECPAYFIGDEGTAPKTFAYMGDDRIREHSSSGGVFGAIAASILADNGYVCGASWTKGFKVEHRIINRISDLGKLQMSKYIRSDIRPVIDGIRSCLENQRKVLFVGCPCQVAAVKRFIGENGNLLTIDLICSEAPSHWIFKQYLDENYDVDNIQEIGFRSKEDGWRPDSLFIRDFGGKKAVKHMEDSSQKAFHSRLMMDISCEHCNFVKLPRIGDISIGDAWGILEYDASLDDKKGTSIILINNKKGWGLYQIASVYAQKTREIPFEWTIKNRTVNCIYPHVGRDRFYKEINRLGFNKAFEDADKGQYDIGIVGNWSYPNYGSELTYFALYHVLKDMGYSVFMIEWPEDSYWKPCGCTQLFEIEPYDNDEIAPFSRNHYEMRRYNDKCRMFVLGSDQLLNPNLYHAFGKTALLDWIEIDKKKIGYALSFGREDVDYASYDKMELSYYFHKFNDISVREKTAVEQMKNIFGVMSDWVLDPVFLCKESWYKMAARKYDRPEKTGVFAYILDSNEKTESALMKMAEMTHESVHIFRDAAKMGTESQVIDTETLSHISVERWLGELMNSRFVVADSFHGICFAIIFHKDFIAIRNDCRGGTRFDSILGQLGLEDRLIEDIDDIIHSNLLDKKIDFEDIERKLAVERSRSLIWLEDALKKENKIQYSKEERFLEEKLKAFEKRIYEGME